MTSNLTDLLPFEEHRLPRCGGQLLAGMTEEEVPNLEALEACARLIERVERGASPG